MRPYVNNFIIEKAIRDDAFLHGEERFLLLILKSYRHVYTLDCNPPLVWLSATFGRSERTVQRVLSRLEKKDYLISIRTGFNKPNHYYFTLDF